MVELAIILPALLLLTVGVLDIGRGFSTYLALTNGAREGARWLSLHSTDTSGALQRVYREAAQEGLGAADLTVNVTTGGSGQIAAVRVRYDFQLLLGLLPRADLPIDITVSMVIL